MDEHTAFRNLLTIPPEILDLILGQLTKHDLSVCLRVCRNMYDKCIDHVWHTISFSGSGNTLDPRKDSFRATYDRGSVRARESLSRNILRIRELRIASEDILGLFYFDPPNKEGPTKGGDCSGESGGNNVSDAGGSGAEGGAFEDLNLQVLQISLGSTVLPQLQPKRSIWMDSKEVPSGLRAILQLLGRSKKLREATLGFGYFRDGDMRVKRAPSDFSTSEHLPVLPHLKLLNIGCFGLDNQVYKSLLQRCPSIEELHVTGQGKPPPEDSSLAELITLKGSFAPRAGWKTLGFDNIPFGPLTIDAILEHCGTLESFTIGEMSHFPSSALQKLLSSAPRLKRFNTIPAFSSQMEQDSCKLLATDILLSDWVCLELQYFRCMIGGIPRPDLHTKTNGQALMSELHNKDRYSAQDSRLIQRQVLARLGGLTKLVEITLGQDSMGGQDVTRQTQVRVFLSRSAMEIGKQYACLSMNLENGLDQLKNLKNLRKLNLGGMAIRQGQKELSWVKDNWPTFQDE